MTKLELENSTVENLRKEASRLKIKNYIKFGKVELVDKILAYEDAQFDNGNKKAIAEAPVLWELPELSAEEEAQLAELDKKEDLTVKPKVISLEEGSEVNFKDPFGDDHTGIITGKAGNKIKIKASDDGVNYQVKPELIEGYIPEVLNTASKDDSYTDKNGLVLVVGQTVFVTIKGSIKKAVINLFKDLKDEQYANVSVEGEKLSKDIHLADIDAKLIVGESKAVKEDKKSQVSKDAPSKEEKKSEIIKTEENKEDSPLSKSDRIRLLLAEGKKPSDIAKEIGCIPQYVHNIKAKIK